MWSKICADFLTNNFRHSGTKSPIWLVINEKGADLVNAFGKPNPGTGQASSCEFDNLTWTWDKQNEVIKPREMDFYVRLGIAGDDLWRPDNIFVYNLLEGRDENTPGNYSIKQPMIIPLALETGIHASISTDKDEGQGKTSIPVRTIKTGDRSTEIKRLIVLLQSEDGTGSPVELKITANHNEVVRHTFSDTSQDDLGGNTANWYEVPVVRPFRLHEIYANDITAVTFTIKGADRWVLKQALVLGLDSESGRPDKVVPITSYRDSFKLSTNHYDGQDRLSLPILTDNVPK